MFFYAYKFITLVMSKEITHYILHFVILNWWKIILFLHYLFYLRQSAIFQVNTKYLSNVLIDKFRKRYPGKCSDTYFKTKHLSKNKYYLNMRVFNYLKYKIFHADDGCILYMIKHLVYRIISWNNKQCNLMRTGMIQKAKRHLLEPTKKRIYMRLLHFFRLIVFCLE